MCLNLVFASFHCCIMNQQQDLLPAWISCSEKYYTTQTIYNIQTHESSHDLMSCYNVRGDCFDFLAFQTYKVRESSH